MAGSVLLLGIALWQIEQRIGLPGLSAQPRYSVADRLDQFGDAARGRLAQHYARAGISYPGQRVALLAFKDSSTLQLHVQDGRGEWTQLHRYPIRAASGGPGPKLREGDYQVPEGLYRVSFLNANSRYHVSLRLNYPNDFDRRMARADGRTQLGGDIMIHGKAVSIGCLAMGDEAAEELFTLAADLGMDKLEVVIAPSDPRQTPILPKPDDPAWVAGLYRDIAQRVRTFPP